MKPLAEPLGLTFRDTITGFQGVATGLCQYISGCNQLLLAPGVGEKGEHRDPHWFDEQRCQVIPDQMRVVLDNGDTPGCDLPAPVR